MNKNRQRINNELKTAGYSFYTERNAVWFVDTRTQARYKSIFAVDTFLKMKKDELHTLLEFLRGAFTVNKDRKPTIEDKVQDFKRVQQMQQDAKNLVKILDKK